MRAVSANQVRDWQNGIKVHGRTVQYQRAGATQPRNIKARVAFGATASELQNSIEAYPVRLSVREQDFLSTEPPQKGDTVYIDGARYGVMQAVPTHMGELFVGWRIGAQS